MSFDTANGTRGARRSTGARLLLPWLNKFMMKRIRKNGKAFGGWDALVLTTIGRKSGVERSTPLGCFPGDDGSWLIVAAVAGAPNNPAWYYNIAAHSDKVQIERAGMKIAVTARQLHGVERDQAWSTITAKGAQMAKFQEKTDRQLPVISLTPLPKLRRS